MAGMKGPAGTALSIVLTLLIAGGLDAPGPRAGEDGPGPAKGAPAGKKAAPPAADDRIELPPRAEGKSRPLTLKPGETLLLIVLQALADESGLKVILGRGNATREQTILLPKEIESSRESISRALDEAGFSVEEMNDERTGQKSLWISRKLKPTSKRGSISTPGERTDASNAPSAPAGATARDARVRVFQDGEGGGGWLVLLETRSRAEAEDAASVLRVYLDRKAKKSAPASTK
jgi:hypothetical protein